MNTSKFASLLIVIWPLFIGNGNSVFSGMKDMPEHCNFTKLLCNDSRLLKDDKTIILNIANALRNRVAEGSFKYHNITHDPIVNMNKLYWNETLASKAAEIVSKCPKVTPSFIKQETSIVPDKDGIDQIKIVSSIDPKKYKPGNEVAGCEVSNIYYEEKQTQCSPQKIKERMIRLLSDGGLGSEGRKYDIRDFWIVNRFGEPKLTFRRHEAHNIGCSFMIRISKTHYHTYLTCIHCPFSSSLPILGHAGENCPKHLPSLDKKYEFLCSDLKNEYEDIHKDLYTVECERGPRTTSSHSDSKSADKGSNWNLTGAVTVTDSHGRVVTDAFGRVVTKPRLHTVTDSSGRVVTRPDGLPIDADKMETGTHGLPVPTDVGNEKHPHFSIETSSCKTTYIRKNGLTEEKFPVSKVTDNTSEPSFKNITGTLSQTRISKSEAPSTFSTALLSSSSTRVTQTQTNRTGTTISTRVTTSRQLDTTRTIVPTAKKPQPFTTTIPNSSKFSKTTSQRSTLSSIESTRAKLSTTSVSSVSTVQARTSSPDLISTHSISSKITNSSTIRVESLPTSAKPVSVFSKLPTTTSSRAGKTQSSIVTTLAITKFAASTKTSGSKLPSANVTSTPLVTSPVFVSTCKTALADTTFNHSTQSPVSSKTSSVPVEKFGSTIQTFSTLKRVHGSSIKPDISAHTERNVTIAKSSSIAAPSTSLPTTKKAMVTSSILMTTPSTTSRKSTMSMTQKSASTRIQTTARSLSTRTKSKLSKLLTTVQTVSSFKTTSTMASTPSPFTDQITSSRSPIISVFTSAASQVSSISSSSTTKKNMFSTASKSKSTVNVTGISTSLPFSFLVTTTLKSTMHKQNQSKWDLIPSSTPSTTVSTTFVGRLVSSTCKTVIVPRSSPTSQKNKSLTNPFMTDTLESKKSEINQSSITYGTSFTSRRSSPLSILNSIKSGSTEGHLVSTTSKEHNSSRKYTEGNTNFTKVSGIEKPITFDNDKTRTRIILSTLGGIMPLTKTTSKTTKQTEMVTSIPSSTCKTARPSNDSGVIAPSLTIDNKNTDIVRESTTIARSLPCDLMGMHSLYEHKQKTSSHESPSTEASTPSATTCKTTTRKDESAHTTPHATTCRTTLSNKPHDEELAPVDISTLSPSTEASAPSATTCKTTIRKDESAHTTPHATTCRTTLSNKPHDEELAPVDISTLSPSTEASAPSATTCKTTTHKGESVHTTPHATTCRTTLSNKPHDEELAPVDISTLSPSTEASAPSATTCKTTTRKGESTNTTPLATTCRTTLSNKPHDEELAPVDISTLSPSTEASAPSTTTCKTTTRRSESSTTTPFATTCRTTLAHKSRSEESDNDALCTTCRTEIVTRVNNPSNRSEKPIPSTRLYQDGGTSKEKTSTQSAAPKTRPITISSKPSVPSTDSRSTHRNTPKRTEVTTTSTTALSIAEANIVSTFTTCKSTTKLTLTPPPESATDTTCKTTKQVKTPPSQPTTMNTTDKATTKLVETISPVSITSTTCKTIKLVGTSLLESTMMSTTNATRKLAETHYPISNISTTKLVETISPVSITSTTCKTTKLVGTSLLESTMMSTTNTTRKLAETHFPISNISTTCKTTTKLEGTPISTCKTVTPLNDDIKNSTKAASDTQPSMVTTLRVSKVPSPNDTGASSIRGKSTATTKMSSLKIRPSTLTSYHSTAGTRSPNSTAEETSLINSVSQVTTFTKLRVSTQASARAPLTTKTPISSYTSSVPVTTCKTTTKLPPSTTSDLARTIFETDIISTTCRTTTPRISTTSTPKVRSKIDSTVRSTTCKTTVGFIRGANTRARGDILTLTRGTLFNASFYTSTLPSSMGHEQEQRIHGEMIPSNATRMSTVHGSGFHPSGTSHSTKQSSQFPCTNIFDCNNLNRTESAKNSSSFDNTVNVTSPPFDKNDSGQVFGTQTTGGYIRGAADHQNSSAYPPIFKPKPCLCINWYLICLIFTIAFIFAWCLLCWQKMLL